MQGNIQLTVKLAHWLPGLIARSIKKSYILKLSANSI